MSRYLVCRVCGGEPGDPRTVRVGLYLAPMRCTSGFHAGDSSRGFELTSREERKRLDEREAS